MIFKDLVVLELASVLAGPAVGLFFAELGAKVIKIENSSTEGDVTRRWRLADEDKSRHYSAYYCSVNWHKETIFKNLRDEADQAFIFDLVKEVDIVIANFKSSSAAKLGMDYNTLKEIKPSLIYGQINGYKYKDKPAFDVILQAETGFLSMNGEPNGQPVKMPVALIDVLAAHQLKEGILIALLHKYQTGKGSFVETSLEEAAIASLVNQASNYLMEGHIAKRLGVEHPNIVPYGTIFSTKDGIDLVIGVGTEKQFANLCHCLDIPEIAQDKKFETNKQRVLNRVEINQILADRFKFFSFDTIFDCLLKAGVPIGKLNTIQDVFQSKVGNEMILTEKMEDGEISKRVASIAFKIK